SEAPTSRPGLDRDLAQRLDRLSRSDAERVLERAIRIQSQRHASDSFTPEQVRRIAGELGLEPSIVDRALREEVAEARPEKDGLLGPRRLVDRCLIAGAPDEVEGHIMTWLEVEEGLKPIARTPDGVRWAPDKHWATSTRMALGTEGTKALRGMPEVVHRQTSLSPTEQLVELEVDTGRIRATALGLGGGLAAAGLAAGGIVAGAVPGGNDLVQFLLPAVPGVAVGAATMLATAKGWATSVRRGMARALDGISHPELNQRTRRRRQRRQRRRQTQKG